MTTSTFNDMIQLFEALQALKDAADYIIIAIQDIELCLEAGEDCSRSHSDQDVAMLHYSIAKMRKVLEVDFGTSQQVETMLQGGDTGFIEAVLTI